MPQEGAGSETMPMGAGRGERVRLLTFCAQGQGRCPCHSPAECLDAAGAQRCHPAGSQEQPRLLFPALVHTPLTFFHFLMTPDSCHLRFS